MNAVSPNGERKRGEVFVPGDVLLQIVCAQHVVAPLIYYWIKESDIAMVHVEAHSPGILEKIIVCSYERRNYTFLTYASFLVAARWNNQRAY